MTDEQVNDLLKRYKEGRCTKDEIQLIMSWYNQLDDESAADPDIAELDAAVQRVSDRLNGHQGKSVKLYRFRYWLVAAAVIVLFATSAAWFIFSTTGQHQNIYTSDISAGGNKAVLTLANGQQIVLDSAANGTIASQAGVIVTKHKNGLIVYAAVSPVLSGKEGETAFNTISTPNGGQYQIILPDGSRVYLNAASSLKYPVKFAGNERKVSLTGEGYFEIAKSTTQPFVLSTLTQTIKVLGTHFNVSSYTDEPAKTTLAEGKVLVTDAGNHFPSKILAPGQQAISTNNNDLKVKQVDLTEELAWKDGIFAFNNTSLKNLLQQVSRWYDVTVDYSHVPDVVLAGEVSRDVPLSEIIRVVEITSHVKLKLEGRRITVQ